MAGAYRSAPRPCRRAAPLTRWVVAALGVAAAATAAAAQVQVDAPDATKGGYRLRGYTLSLADPTVASVLGAAATAGKEVSIFAVSLVFPPTLDVSGVPVLRLYAHECSTAVGAAVTVVSRGADGPDAPGAVPPPAATGQTGSTPATPAVAGRGGTVGVYCDRWTAPTDLTVDVRGGAGGSGGPGGPGGRGVIGSASTNGVCQGGVFTCNGREGKQGKASGDGGAGGRGGRGGGGGAGGNVAVLRGPSSAALTVKTLLTGGRGGVGGVGGAGAAGGPNFPPWKKVTNCRCSGFACSRCAWVTHTISRRDTRKGRDGRRGSFGSSGVGGFSSTGDTPSGLPRRFVPPPEVQVWVRLLRQFTADQLLSVESAPSAAPGGSVAATMDAAAAVLGTLDRAAGVLPPAAGAVLRDAAGVLGARVAAGSGYFGRAALSRTSPSSVAARLDAQYEYARQVAAVAGSAATEANLLSVVTQAASIGLPSKDFAELARALRDRRALTVAAVDSAQREIDAALGDVASRLAAAEIEAVRAKALGQLDQILSLASAGAGLGGAVAGRDPFAAFQSALEIGEVVAEIVGDAQDAGCSINDLKDLLSDGADLDMRAGFPSGRDFDQDLSIVQRIDLIATVRKADLEAKAAELTAQMACVFSTDGLASVPSVRAAFDRLFIRAASRADLVDAIVDMDAELRALVVERAGVEAQRTELADLAGSSQGALARATTVDALTAQYEAARDGVLGGLASLAFSFRAVSLIDFGGVLAGFARRRLDANGVLPVPTEHLALEATRLALTTAFEQTAVCFGELPDRRFFFWDVPVRRSDAPASPDGGEEGEVLASGPASPFSFTLSFYADCGQYGRTAPPVRGLPTVPVTPGAADCAPNNNRFNSRMVSMAVELVGGDSSLLPPGRTAVAAFIHQVGRQSFRRTPSEVLSVDATPLLVPLADSPLGPAAALEMRPFCERATSAISFIDTPRACPSPFSAYVLQLGRFGDPALDPYLASVRAVRVHARLSSSSSLCLPGQPRRVVAPVGGGAPTEPGRVVAPGPDEQPPATEELELVEGEEPTEPGTTVTVSFESAANPAAAACVPPGVVDASPLMPLCGA